VYEKLIEAEKKQNRLLGTYYRVGFYGQKFGARLDGNEFIYKMPKIFRLAEMCSHMKKLYHAQLKHDVKILQDSNPVDVTKLDAQDCIMQITFVTPLFDAEEKAKRESFIDLNTNVVSFKFSTPFTKSGKAYGDISDQHKRNTVLFVKDPFPYMKTAQKVIRRVETILSPIESAVEDIEMRIDRLQTEVDASVVKGEVNKKGLTGVLAGTVAPQVHGGAKEICLAFFKDAKEPVDADRQQKLRDVMHKFLTTCQRALEANRKVIESEVEKEFQANLDQQFDEMCAVMQPLLAEPKKAKGEKGQKGKHKRSVRFN